MRPSKETPEATLARQELCFGTTFERSTREANGKEWLEAELERTPDPAHQEHLQNVLAQINCC